MTPLVAKVNFRKKFVSGLMAFVFATGAVGTSYARTIVPMPVPGAMVSLSAAFAPPLLKGIKVYSDNPFRFDFILDVGPWPRGEVREPPPYGARGLRSESERLIKYFLASLTIPEKDLWVNLSPYEKHRIVPEAFGQTEMGRDLLAQDYLLKQITASVIYPEGETGKKFWAEVYRQAKEKFGTTDIPVDTFNKVWIVPEKAVVYENKNLAYVVEGHLKVMLETDYLATSKGKHTSVGEVHEPPLRDAMRSIVIPLLEKEVNEGRNFAQLRQIYHSLILAAWYKKKIRESLLSAIYADKNKIEGIKINDPDEINGIWDQYVRLFRKGVYDYIKEEPDVFTGEIVPRKYFSGGAALGEIDSAMKVTGDPGDIHAEADQQMIIQARVDRVKTNRALPRVTSRDIVFSANGFAEALINGRKVWEDLKIVEGDAKDFADPAKTIHVEGREFILVRKKSGARIVFTLDRDRFTQMAEVKGWQLKRDFPGMDAQDVIISRTNIRQMMENGKGVWRELERALRGRDEHSGSVGMAMGDKKFVLKRKHTGRSVELVLNDVDFKELVRFKGWKLRKPLPEAGNNDVVFTRHGFHARVVNGREKWKEIEALIGDAESGLEAVKPILVQEQTFELVRKNERARAVFTLGQSLFEQMAKLQGWQLKEVLPRVDQEEIVFSSPGFIGALERGKAIWEEFKDELGDAGNSSGLTRKIIVEGKEFVLLRKYSSAQIVFALDPESFRELAGLKKWKLKEDLPEVAETDVSFSSPGFFLKLKNGGFIWKGFKEMAGEARNSPGLKKTINIKGRDFDLLRKRSGTLIVFTLDAGLFKELARSMGWRLREDENEGTGAEAISPGIAVTEKEAVEAPDILRSSPDVLLDFLVILNSQNMTPGQIRIFIRNFKNLNLGDVFNTVGGGGGALSRTGGLIQWLFAKAEILKIKEERDRRALIEGFKRVAFLDLMNEQFKDDVLQSLNQIQGQGVFFKELYAAVLELTGEAMNFKAEHIRSILEPHQKVGAYALSKHDRFYLGDATGLGKSVQVLAALDFGKKTFISVPASLVDKWVAEIHKHVDPQVLKHTRVIPLRGNWAQRKLLIEEANESCSSGCIFVGSIQGMRLRTESDLGALMDGLDTLVIDEVQHISNWHSEGRKANSQQAQAMQILMRHSRRVWALSATGYGAHPKQLFAVLHGLDPVNFSDYRSFRKNYDLDSVEGYVHLRDKISQIGMMREKDDVMRRYVDPEKIPFSQQGRRLPRINVIPYKGQGGFVLNGEQHELLMMMVQDFKAYAQWYNRHLREGQVPLDVEELNPFTKLRFIQMLMIDPRQAGGNTSSPLWNELDKIIGVYLSKGKQGVIFVQNVFAREILASHLREQGIGFEEIHGDIISSKREKARERFQNGEVPLIIVNAKAGGEGLDYTAADFMIEAQLAETYPQRVQLEGRAERIDDARPHYMVDYMGMVARLDPAWLEQHREGPWAQTIQRFLNAQEGPQSPHEIQAGRLEEQKSALQYLRMRIDKREGLRVLDPMSLVKRIPGFMEDRTIKAFTASLGSDRLKQVLDLFFPFYAHARDVTQREEILRVAELFFRTGEMPDSELLKELVGGENESVLKYLAALGNIPSKYVRQRWTSRAREAIARDLVGVNAQELLAEFDVIEDEAPFLVLPLYEVSRGFNDTQNVEVILDLLDDVTAHYEHDGQARRNIYQQVLLWLTSLERTERWDEGRERLGLWLGIWDDVFQDQNVDLALRLEALEKMTRLAGFGSAFYVPRRTSGEKINDLLKKLDQEAMDQLGSAFALNGEESRALLRFKEHMTALEMIRSLNSTAGYSRQAAQLKEIIKHISDNDFEAWRDHQEGDRREGSQVSYMKDVPDFWRVWTRNEFVQVGDVEVLADEFMEQLRGESLQLRSMLPFDDARLIREIDGDWVGDQFLRWRQEAPGFPEQARKRKEALAIAMKNVPLDDEENKILAAALQEEGIPSDGSLKESVAARLHEYGRLSQWLSLWSWVQEIIQGKLPNGDLRAFKILASKLVGRSRLAMGTALFNRMDSLIYLFERIEKRLRFKDLTIQFTGDPELILKRGLLTPELADCFNVFGDPKQFSTLVDDLGSRNKIMALVREGGAEGRVIARAMFKVKRTEAGVPVVFLERGIYRGGYDFEPQILKAFERSKGGELRPFGVKLARQVKSRLSEEPVFDTGGYSEFEYFEPLFGVRQRDVHGGQIYHQAEFIDFAMTGEETGGIDFTGDKTPLEVRAPYGGISFDLDPAMFQEWQDAPGVVPVIINIQPVTDLHAFLTS